MPNVVLDASSLVGALLKPGSIPERAFLTALRTDTICLSAAVGDEVSEVFFRPKFKRAGAERGPLLLAALLDAAVWVFPSVIVTNCRDPKDNKYLELALAASAHCIVSSGLDLLELHPWRGIPVLTPAAYLAWRA